MNGNNTTSGDECLDTINNRPQFWFVGILLPLAIFGAVGNSLVIFAPIVEKELRRGFHIPIASLALTGLIMSLLHVPLSIAGQFVCFPKYFAGYCGFSSFLRFVYFYCLYVQSLIAYYRYRIITSSLKHTLKGLSVRFLLTTSLSVLLVSATLSGYLMYTTTTSSTVLYQPMIGHCSVKGERLNIQGLGIWCFVFLPMFLSFGFYGKIFAYVRANSFIQTMRLKRERKLAITFFGLFLSWILVYGMLCSVRLSDTNMELLEPIVHQIAYVLLWTSSCLNPIIHGLTDQRYRRAYLGTLRICSSQIPAPSNTNPTLETAQTVGHTEDESGNHPVTVHI